MQVVSLIDQFTASIKKWFCTIVNGILAQGSRVIMAEDVIGGHPSEDSRYRLHGDHRVVKWEPSSHSSTTHPPIYPPTHPSTHLPIHPFIHWIMNHPSLAWWENVPQFPSSDGNTFTLGSTLMRDLGARPIKENIRPQGGGSRQQA